jgi:hypothetical protein
VGASLIVGKGTGAPPVSTAIVYYWLGLYSASSTRIFVSILPSVAIGIPLGAYIIRHIAVAAFRRICASFDAWIVGFGLSRAVIGLGLLLPSGAYTVWATVILVDGYLLYLYFGNGRTLLRATIGQIATVQKQASGKRTRAWAP